MFSAIIILAIFIQGNFVYTTSIVINKGPVSVINNAPNNFKPLILKRFIDDIFMIWRHEEDELETFWNSATNVFQL